MTFLILMYARSSLNDIYTKYLKYHKQIHNELLQMERGKVDEIAKQTSEDQTKMSFRVGRSDGELEDKSSTW